MLTYKYVFEQVFYEISLIKPDHSHLASEIDFVKFRDSLQAERLMRFPQLEKENINRYQKEFRDAITKSAILSPSVDDTVVF